VCLEDLHHLVSVSRVPQLLQVMIPVVAKEDVRLSEEMLVGIGFESLFDPVDHRPSHFSVLEIFKEWVHPVKRDDHGVVPELVNVVTTIHPGALNSRIGCNLSVGSHILEHNLPQIAIEFVLEAGCGRLIVIHDVVVAEDGQDGNLRECTDDGVDSSPHGILHQIPVVRGRIELHSQAMFAQITHE